jgi:hypothetical protein
VSAAETTYVAIAVVPDASGIPDGLLSSYHCHKYDPVPPVTVDDNVADCPLSIVTEERSTDIEGAESTVTETIDEVAVADGVAEPVPVSVNTT